MQGELLPRDQRTEITNHVMTKQPVGVNVVFRQMNEYNGIVKAVKDLKGRESAAAADLNEDNSP